MKPVAEASGVQAAPYNHFGLRVLSPDAAHVELPLLGGEHVTHLSSRSGSSIGHDSAQAAS